MTDLINIYLTSYKEKLKDEELASMICSNDWQISDRDIVCFTMAGMIMGAIKNVICRN